MSTLWKCRRNYIQVAAGGMLAFSFPEAMIHRLQVVLFLALFCWNMIGWLLKMNTLCICKTWVGPDLTRGCDSPKGLWPLGIRKDATTLLTYEPTKYCLITHRETASQRDELFGQKSRWSRFKDLLKVRCVHVNIILDTKQSTIGKFLICYHQ